MRTILKGWDGAETEADARLGLQTASEGGRVGQYLLTESQRAGGWRPMGDPGTRGWARAPEKVRDSLTHRHVGDAERRPRASGRRSWRGELRLGP